MAGGWTTEADLKKKINCQTPGQLLSATEGPAPKGMEEAAPSLEIRTSLYWVEFEPLEAENPVYMRMVSVKARRTGLQLHQTNVTICISK